MNFDEIKKALFNADIVSFDIFDTLVTRITLHPIDVFEIVDIIARQRLDINLNFKQLRIEAEQSLQNSSIRRSYNLRDIYNIISSIKLIDKDICQELMNFELEIEHKVLIPRKDILELYTELNNLGKKIILVSDMYLSSVQLKELLLSCGYNTDNVDIFVSNEYKAIKEDCTLWEKVIEKFGSKKIIHIGDNHQSDYLCAKKKGIISIPISSSLELFQKSKMYSTLSEYDDGSVGNSILLGRLCNDIIFNNAFSTNYNSNDVLGIFNGAVFSCFMRWLINTCDDSLLLFVTREGFIFQPIYLAYCKAAGIEPQKNCLFYTSRQAASRASIQNIKDLTDLLSMKYSGTLFTFVTQKCGYPIDRSDIKDFEILLPRDKSEVLKSLEAILPKIIENSKKAQKIYSEYIDNCCAENNCDKLTIVDIGYLATTQFLLTKITNKEIKGKYLITDIGVYPEIKNEVNSLGKISENVHPIHNNIQFFESSIQVPYGQLLAVTQNESEEIQFIFNNAKQTSPIIINAHQEYLKFAEKDAEWFGFLNKRFDYSLNLAEDIWMCLIYYNYLPTDFLNSFCFDDEFNGDEILRYDPALHAFKTSSQIVPFSFSKNKNNAFRKQKLKNFVKKYSPSFLYLPLKNFWIRFIR